MDKKIISKHKESNVPSIKDGSEHFLNKDLEHLVKDLSKEHELNAQMDQLEIEHALTKVNENIDQTERSAETPVYDISGKKSYSFLYLLAASLLIVAIGTSWLFSNVVYEAPLGQKLSFKLPDGSQVELNSGSELRHNRLFGRTNRKITMQGEVFYNVVKNEMPFIINASNGIVEVTGTSFNVRAWNSSYKEDVMVSVLSGSVRLMNNRQTDAVNVQAGEVGKVSHIDGSVSEPAIFIPDRVLAWRSGNLSFYNQPLVQIFRELERAFNVKITFSEAEIGSTNLTTYYSKPDSIEQILNDISTVKGLTFNRTANGFHISMK